MRGNVLLQFVRKRPFQPFRITLTDGSSYEVRHPELAMLGLDEVVIGIQQKRKNEPIFDRMVTVSLAHVMEVEALKAPSPERN